MSYLRVIPRDLFNEASLLKCFGRIYINLECLDMDAVLEHNGDAFEIEQNESSGGIYLANVTLTVRGKECTLERPLNSRQAWPLYLATEDDETIAVFDDDGGFTDEMMAFLKS